MKKVIPIILLLFSHQLMSQSTAGLNLYGFLPTGELKKDAPEIWGGGFGLEAAINIKESSLYLGGQVDFTRFGSELRDGYHGPEIGDVRYRRQYEMLRIMGLIRVKPDFSIPIYPYIDVYLGAGNIFTRSIIRESFEDDPIQTFNDFSQWGFMYGFGLGYEFFLSDHLILDFNVRSMRSSRVEYLSPNSVSYDSQNHLYILEVQSSPFTNLNFGFGFKLYFGEVLNQVIGEVYNTALSTIYKP